MNTSREGVREGWKEGGRKGWRETSREALAHAHNTCVAEAQHIGHFLVVAVTFEKKPQHTHTCPHGTNKCDCMLMSPLV